METGQRTRRLCSEIQLFDLCDLESCRQKDGRFCTNEEVVQRFEAIKEEDERPQYVAEDLDEDLEGDELDEFGIDEGDDADDYGDDDL